MNKRLIVTFKKAISDRVMETSLLDAYNNQVVTNGVSFTVTTRTFGDNNHWLMEYED